jgi:hypothetical protein
MRRGPSRTQGWLRFWDHAEHSHYYHHPSSGQTSWEEPPGATAGHGLDPARDGPAHENGAFPEAPAEEGAPGAGEPGNVTEAPPGSPPGEPGTVPGGCMHWPAQCPPPAVPAPEHGPAVAHTGCAYHDGYDWDAYAREYGCAHVCRVHAAVHCDCVYVRERASVCTTVCVVLARSVRVVLARSVPYSRTLLTYPPHVPSSRTLLTYPTHVPYSRPAYAHSFPSGYHAYWDYYWGPSASQHAAAHAPADTGGSANPVALSSWAQHTHASGIKF